MDYRLDSPDQPNPEWDATRQAMGHARKLSEQIDLATLTPLPNLASTGYCLANPGTAYLVYHPRNAPRELSIQFQIGRYRLSWLDASSGKRVSETSFPATGVPQSINCPIPDAALLIAQSE